MDAVSFDMPREAIPFSIVTGSVEGIPIRILVDTGAALPFDVMLSPSLAERTGLAIGEHQATARGAVGGHTVTLRSLRVGPILVESAAAAVMPAIDAVSAQIGVALDAVIGQRFLGKRSVPIDYGCRYVDFDAAARRTDATSGFTLGPKGPVLLVGARINGCGPFTMALDTAASVTLLATAAIAGVVAEQEAALAARRRAAPG